LADYLAPIIGQSIIGAPLMQSADIMSTRLKSTFHVTLSITSVITSREVFLKYVQPRREA